MARWFREFVLTAICFGAVAGSGFAQIDRAVLTGTVTDPAGAVIPNANVTATNVSTAFRL
jgi:hypothetical protein